MELPLAFDQRRRRSFHLHLWLDGKQPLFRRGQTIAAAQKIPGQRHAMSAGQATTGLERLSWDFSRHYNECSNSEGLVASGW